MVHTNHKNILQQKFPDLWYNTYMLSLRFKNNSFAHTCQTCIVVIDINTAQTIVNFCVYVQKEFQLHVHTFTLGNTEA